MWSFFLAALNCLVGNEPRVAATAQIAPTSMRPAPDVAFVLVRNADCEAVELHTPGFREVKDAFMTIVKKPLRIDWLEMTVRFYRGFDTHLALRVRVGIATGRSAEKIEVRIVPFSVDGNRFDPVNRVLQKKSA